MAFDLFEPKTPDKVIEEMKRRAEIMEKLKKQEQARQESVKTLLTDSPGNNRIFLCLNHMRSPFTLFTFVFVSLYIPLLLNS